MNGDLLIVLYTNLVCRLTQFVGPQLAILHLIVHKGDMLVHKVKTTGRKQAWDLTASKLLRVSFS